MFIPDYDPEEDEQRDPSPVTCNRCQKAGCYWQEVWTDKGTKHRLYENNKPHECKTAGSADDFEDLG